MRSAGETTTLLDLRARTAHVLRMSPRTAPSPSPVADSSGDVRGDNKSGRGLTPAAQRALAEAQARQAAAERDAEAEVELHGRGGLDPARYGDWEVKGIASDF